MRQLFIAVLPLCGVLAGCVSDPSQMAGAVGPTLGGSEMVYVRADGKRLSSNPVLAQQLDIDKAICRADAEKFGAVSGNEIETEKKNFAVSLINAGIKENKIETIMKGCMAQHGYAYMSVAEAEARADALAAGGPKKHKKHV